MRGSESRADLDVAVDAHHVVVVVGAAEMVHTRKKKKKKKKDSDEGMTVVVGDVTKGTAADGGEPKPARGWRERPTDLLT